MSGRRVVPLARVGTKPRVLAVALTAAAVGAIALVADAALVRGFHARIQRRTRLEAALDDFERYVRAHAIAPAEAVVRAALPFGTHPPPERRRAVHQLVVASPPPLWVKWVHPTVLHTSRHAGASPSMYESKSTPWVPKDGGVEDAFW